VTDVEGVSPDVHPCQLHKTHQPPALISVKHHVQPQGMGGPDVPENWAYVCDTGHRNVHTLLGPMCNVKSPAYGLPARQGTRSERALALRGFEAWVAAGRPGNAHSAYGLV